MKNYFKAMKKYIYFTLIAISIISCKTSSLNKDKLIGVYYNKCYEMGLPSTMFELRDKDNVMLINRIDDNDFGKWYLKNDTITIDFNSKKFLYRVTKNRLYSIVKDSVLKKNSYLKDCYLHKVKNPFFKKDK